jgi:LuxR family maltose regulon positive regulatory protein
MGEQLGNQVSNGLIIHSTQFYPPRFVAFLIAAVQRIRPEIGIAASMLLQTPSATPLKTILSSRLNDLSTLDSRVVQVLDDYHVIDAQPVQDLVSFILEHLPTALRVIITTLSTRPAFG